MSHLCSAAFLVLMSSQKPAVFSWWVAVASTLECLVPQEARAGWKALEAGGSLFSHETDLLRIRRGLRAPLRVTLLYI